MRIYMQTRASEDHAPKFYHIHLDKDLLDGWNVVKEWGAQGSPGRVLKKHFQQIHDAENEALVTRDKQIKKGYRVVFIEGQNKPYE